MVLLSAGVGVTPMMAMLHALAAHASPRPVWWIYGARNRLDHPFARETRDLLAKLAHARSHVQYSRPDAADQLGVDFDAAGRLTATVLEKLGVPRESDFYLCGPPAFLEDFTAGLGGWGVARDRVHTEIFGSGESLTPGVKDAPAGHRTHRPGRPARAQVFHLLAPASRSSGIPSSRACWSSRKPATSRCAGLAGLEFAISASAG